MPREEKRWRGSLSVSGQPARGDIRVSDNQPDRTILTGVRAASFDERNIAIITTDDDLLDDGLAGCLSVWYLNLYKSSDLTLDYHHHINKLIMRVSLHVGALYFFHWERILWP